MSFIDPDRLGAMAGHSSPHLSIRAIEDNTDFLTLVDELEEFSRISRASQNRQYVDEFCRTALECQEGWLVITFLFDHGDPAVIQPELFFRARLPASWPSSTFPTLTRSSS